MDRGISGGSSPYALVMPDLPKLTLRNTFLEFDDCAIDEFSDQEFVRGTSEPAKPFFRKVSEEPSTGSEISSENNSNGWRLQLSERTTAGSDLTPAESTSNAEAEESYAQTLYTLSCGSTSGISSAMWNNGSQQCAETSNMGPSNSKWSQETAIASSFVVPQVPQTQSSQLPQYRYCPNCGAEIEPSHRFCPYCCFHLPQIQLQDSRSLNMMQQGVSVPQTTSIFASPLSGDAGAQIPQHTSVSETDLLSCIRRFRYMDALPGDIERANRLCDCLMRGLPVA